MPILTYRVNTIQSPTQQDIFVEIDKLILIFTWKGKGTKIAKMILRKNKRRGIIQ